MVLIVAPILLRDDTIVALPHTNFDSSKDRVQEKLGDPALSLDEKDAPLTLS